MRFISLTVCLLVALSGSACSSQSRSQNPLQSDRQTTSSISRSEPIPVEQTTPAAGEQNWPAPVGKVALISVSDLPEERRLDVDLVLFDPGLTADISRHGTRGIFPDIRKAEGHYLPTLLRQTLATTGAWGVVRVLPQTSESAQVLVQGTILYSDGQRLALRIQARDASGRLWFDTVYTDLADGEDYPVADGDDPYSDLYRRIANDLLTVRQQLDTAALTQIQRLARLRYAASLAPDVFGSYFTSDEHGRYHIQRLPAQDDPMVERIGRIREQEYRFIDTVDEQYVDLLEGMRPTYNLWRQYGREQLLYADERQQQLLARDRIGRRGSFAAMKQTYEAFKWSKIQQQELQELALGFNNEVTPTVLDVNGRIFRLSGSLDSRYEQWRAILRQIFMLESGLLTEDGIP
ncbi:MAG: hypothetical protein ACK5ME_12040 [Parahaliea sp.]